ncbi:MBL fold metallo-hydrolase [Alkaliphilus peptidifermentans]|uniref:Phosphoribosyl 1,2-cyclic phosphodiesterase n=1 Tax=Alkaliphilus peptidifermentans DSM 18978 TaxID=1120976 RepID=A0A1G5HCY8_9FIRM|nr:MBL fold metallo-hydrolase [Alkaliphilus peptidifermentans]SCY61531.1 Phosphoribosyl 1,2-cyclic phosphodiesterase [Alkaliphilus peptidifermentans DSM 18978]
MTVRFCSLASGSSGNCHFITDDSENLLVDAGLSGKKIQSKLLEIGIDPCRLTGILISHEHNDHIHSAGILSRRFNIPIYANVGTWRGMEEKLGKLKEEHIKIFETGKIFEVGDFIVTPYSTSHDANDPVGFSLINNGVKISITTDLGYINDEIIEHVRDSNLVVLESNHDEEMLKVGSYPYYLKRRILSNLGHLSNDAAGLAIVDLVRKNVKKVMLAHLSKENNFPELAIATVNNILALNKMIVGEDVEIVLAHRDRVSNLYEFSK